MTEKQDKVGIVLNCWERITLTSIIGNIRGNVMSYRKASKVLDLLELSAEERSQVELRAIAPNQFTWNDRKKEWEIFFSEELFDFIKKVMLATESLPFDKQTGILLDKMGIGED